MSLLTLGKVTTAEIDSATLTSNAASSTISVIPAIPAQPASFLRFLKKGNEVPSTWDVAFAYFKAGKITPEQPASEFPVIDSFGVYKGILGDFAPYVSGDEIRFHKGMIASYGRQAIWDDSSAVGHGTDYPNGGFIYVYVITDLTDPSSQKCYFLLSQSSTLSKGDNLMTHEGGISRSLIACFYYDYVNSALSYVNPSGTETTNAIPIPYIIAGKADRTISPDHINRKNASELMDGAHMRWADASALGRTDKRILNFGAQAFSAYLGTYRDFIEGEDLDGSLLHLYDRENVPHDTPYYSKNFLFEQRSLPALNVIGFDIVLGKPTATSSSGHEYALRCRARKARKFIEATTDDVFDSQMATFHRTIWLPNAPADFTLNFYLVYGLGEDFSRIGYSNWTDVLARKVYESQAYPYYPYYCFTNSMFNAGLAGENYHVNADDWNPDYMDIYHTKKVLRYAEIPFTYNSQYHSYIYDRVRRTAAYTDSTSPGTYMWMEFDKGYIDNDSHQWVHDGTAEVRFRIAPIYRTT